MPALATSRATPELRDAVGYESAAQFNREYRRPFGAPPGRDRRRLVAPQLA